MTAPASLDPNTNHAAVFSRFCSHKGADQNRTGVLGLRPDSGSTRLYPLATVALGLALAAATWAGPAYAHTARASAYGPGLYGNSMSCGGTLRPHTRAVAHRWLPCGTRVRVCYAWRCSSARVRDRGPYVPGRTLDLSEALVRALGYRDAWAWGVRVVVWNVR